MTLRSSSFKRIALVATVALSFASAACSSKVDSADCSNGACADPATGSGGAGGSSECKLDAPPDGLTFTFHVHNAGSTPRSVPLGCGSTIPIQLDTAAGPVAASLESIAVFDCIDSCEDAFKAPSATPGVPFCSDCGDGVGKDLPVGAVVDIPWNRVGRVADTVPPACVGSAGISSCGRGVAVAATAMQKGTLTVCSNAASGGDCSGPESQIAVTFTLDMTKSEATIEVM